MMVPCEAQKFPHAASCKISLSSVRSEIARRSRRSPSPAPSLAAPDPASDHQAPSADGSTSARSPRCPDMPLWLCDLAQHNLYHTQLPMISSSLRFFAGIRDYFFDPECHLRWITQKGAAQPSLVEKAAAAFCSAHRLAKSIAYSNLRAEPALICDAHINGS